MQRGSRLTHTLGGNGSIIELYGVILIVAVVVAAKEEE